MSRNLALLIIGISAFTGLMLHGWMTTDVENQWNEIYGEMEVVEKKEYKIHHGVHVDREGVVVENFEVMDCMLPVNKTERGNKTILRSVKPISICDIMTYTTYKQAGVERFDYDRGKIVRGAKQ